MVNIKPNHSLLFLVLSFFRWTHQQTVSSSSNGHSSQSNSCTRASSKHHQLWKWRKAERWTREHRMEKKFSEALLYFSIATIGLQEEMLFVCHAHIMESLLAQQSFFFLLSYLMGFHGICCTSEKKRMDMNGNDTIWKYKDVWSAWIFIHFIAILQFFFSCSGNFNSKCSFQL